MLSSITTANVASFAKKVSIEKKFEKFEMKYVVVCRVEDRVV